MLPGVQGCVNASTLPLPTQLADVEVRFGYSVAPISSVCNSGGQETVTVQAPFELGAPGSTSATVTVKGASATVNDIPVLTALPGIFERVEADGRRYAIANRSDGKPVSPTSPARRGETLVVVATGLGAVLPKAATNSPGVEGQNVFLPVIAGVAGRGVRVLSAKYGVGEIGRYWVTLEIPTDTPEGSAVSLVLGSVTREGQPPVYSADSRIAVQGLLLAIAQPSAMPDAIVGRTYSQTLSAQGGDPPYTWTVSSGTLPPGLSLNATSGQVAGTPSSAGVYTFTVRVADKSGSSATRSYTIRITNAPLPAVSITGASGTVAAKQQPEVRVQLAAAYGIDLSGTMTLTFAPDAVNPSDDAAVQFESGGRTISFTIPGNSTSVSVGRLQTGTTAGTITLTVSLRAGQTDVTPSPAPTSTIRILRAAPVIDSARIASKTDSMFEVEVIGYSTPRDLTRATFGFVGTANLETKSLSRDDLGTDATNWYRNPASAQFGSQFKYVQVFTILKGSINDVRSVTVTLHNSSGASESRTINF